MGDVRETIARVLADRYGRDFDRIADPKLRSVYEGEAAAVLAALDAAGFAIVPMEPTEEMQEAGALAGDWAPWGDVPLEDDARKVYAAMLAASPKAAPAQEGG